MMRNFLDKVRQSTIKRVENLTIAEPQIVNHSDFMKIFTSDKISIVAEIKFASPTRSTLYQGKYDHLDIAKLYVENGAAALSVLTEPDYFKGHIQYIADIRKCFPQIPILLKDFILSEVQIKQALQVGASAVLLIAVFLDPQRIIELYNYTLSLGLTPLIEVSSLAELVLVQTWDPKVIVINNRNLTSQHVDLNTSARLISQVKTGRRVISASGIKTGQELIVLQQLGFGAFLIGTILMEQENPGIALNKLLLEANDES